MPKHIVEAAVRGPAAAHSETREREEGRKSAKLVACTMMKSHAQVFEVWRDYAEIAVNTLQSYRNRPLTHIQLLGGGSTSNGPGGMRCSLEMES